MRLLLIGSLLPDIIDKPVGLFFFKETFSNGRIFCHTLLFLVLITTVGLYYYRRHSKAWIITLSFGTLMHLILDQMWRTPQTLLWPLLGVYFERADITNWTLKIFYSLFTNPAIYIPELVGTAILVYFTWMLIRIGKIRAVIECGRV